MVTDIVLTDEQQAAVDALASCRKDVQTLGGYAGVGKTSIIRTLVNRLKGFRVCAFTGKAAQVLRRKGVDASTIHSLIYHPVQVEDNEVRFELVTPWEFEPRGIIVDEASMVGRPIYDDLTKFGVPLIFVGDHGQLEPVSGGDFNLMAKPDITLEKIHRNAGEIARFAAHLREGHDATDWDSVTGEVVVTSMDRLSEEGTQSDVDQTICAYNKTRVLLNNTSREDLGFPADEPVIGDRVMCLQNDRRIGIYNGMQGMIADIDHRRRILWFEVDDAEFKIPYVAEAFGAERPPQQRQMDRIPFDYSYCVTCHKAQGDEWGHVMVFEQRCGAWSHQRWAYTAASRAKKHLTWVAA